MSLNRNSYTLVGLGLLITGILLSPIAYFILRLNWLSATGISMLILASILIALGKSIPKLPPEVSGLLLETSIDNMATIIEELGLKARAVYLPSSLTADAKPRALIPLHANPALPPINEALPQRFIVRYGTRPDDLGLLLSTIGSSAMAMLESKPGASPEELEAAFTTLFSGILGVADKTRVFQQGNSLKVEIYNARMENKATWSHRCLGGPLASIVASVVAEACNKPVTIKQEVQNRDKCSIELEVVLW